jgi:poly [ADP-ribose] polymerase 10/14/15
MATRQTILEQQDANDSYERTWLFHGTSEETVSEIVAQGFNRNYGFKEVNKEALTMYGKGVYFAVNSSYSASHRYSKPNSVNEQVMFMCRVLVGEYCQGKEDQPKPDVRTGTDLYDSTVDNLGVPEIFVIFNDVQALPEYIVTFIQQ